jgi:hypothetical protein
MVPSTFMVVDRFPLSANGKVDRKALPAPARIRPQLGTPYVGPRTELERVIAEKWRRILGLDRIGVHDRFFELGGTSLQGARFVNEMQTELGETVYAVTLFGAPSVAEYAALLKRQFPAAVARLRQDRADDPPPSLAPPQAGSADTVTSDTPPVGLRSSQGRHASLASQRGRRLAARSTDQR